MDLIDDLKEFVRLLDAHEVRYMIVGGAAVNVLGYVRMTEDLHFWIERSDNNAERILRALHEFAFSGEFDKTDLLEPDSVLMLGRPPHRIDLLTSISGREFADCWPRYTTETLDGLSVPMIALEDLLINKRASGRPKDLADIDEFERRKR
jgi:predicted nucleotidyltransferase